MDGDVLEYRVSASTGEIVGEIKEGDRIRKKEQDDYCKKYEDFKPDETFLKLYDGMGDILADNLDGSVLKFFLKIAKYTCYQDCILRKNGRKDGKKLSLKDMSELTGFSYSNSRKIMSTLLKVGLVAKTEVGSIIENNDIKNQQIYLMNPNIFFRGESINTTVKSIFEETGWSDLLIKNKRGDIENN